MQEAMLRVTPSQVQPRPLTPSPSLPLTDRQPIKSSPIIVFPVRTCKQHHSGSDLGISQLTFLLFLCRGMSPQHTYPSPAASPSVPPPKFKGLPLEYCVDHLVSCITCHFFKGSPSLRGLETPRQRPPCPSFQQTPAAE